MYLYLSEEKTEQTVVCVFLTNPEKKFVYIA